MNIDLLASASALPTELPSLSLVAKYTVGIVLFLIINALFVAIEFALVKVRKSQLQEVLAEKPVKAKLGLHALSKLDGYLSAGQLGITVASLVLGMLGEPLVLHFVAPIFQNLSPDAPVWVVRGVSITVAAISFSFIHVILGEQVPKVLAIRKPVSTTLMLIRPLHIFYIVFGWAIYIINGTANSILRKCFNVEPVGHDDVHSAAELAMLVKQSGKHDVVTETERDILIKTLAFNDVLVKDVMTPHAEVIGLDVDADFATNLASAIESKHTRFPLIKGDLRDSVGLIHVKDLIKLVNQPNPDLSLIKRPLQRVPETMALDELLTFFLKEHAHLAVAIDAQGEPSGLVFMDNIIEKLVGNIQDEFDAEPENVK